MEIPLVRPGRTRYTRDTREEATMKMLGFLFVIGIVTASCAKNEGKDAPPSQAAPTMAASGDAMAPATTPVPGSATTPPSAPAVDVEALARAAAGAVRDGRHAELVAMFDDTMKAALPLEKLAQSLAVAAMSVGKMKSIGQLESKTRDGYTRVQVTCEHEFYRKVFLRLTFDGQGKIAGMFTVPDPGSHVWTPPAYVKPGAVIAGEVTVGSGEWAVPGTITRLSGSVAPSPAVVLVHGSGPQDRDETAGPNKIFKDLAMGLSSRGIVVLRFDKRTQVHGAKVAKDKAFTLRQESVEDAVLAVRLLASDKGVDPKRIFLLGHSLGARAVPRAAAELGDGAVAGLILMAGSPLALEDKIVVQTAYLAAQAGPASAQTAAQLALIREQAAFVKSDRLTADAPAAKLPLGIGSGAYWLDLRDHDPVKQLRGLKLPVLILQGERDYQVTLKDDFGAWRERLRGRPAVTFKSYPGLNHFFIAGEGPSTPAEYERPGHVEPAVLEDLAAFLLAPRR